MRKGNKSQGGTSISNSQSSPSAKMSAHSHPHTPPLYRATLNTHSHNNSNQNSGGGTRVSNIGGASNGHISTVPNTAASVGMSMNSALVGSDNGSLNSSHHYSEGMGSNSQSHSRHHHHHNHHIGTSNSSQQHSNNSSSGPGNNYKNPFIHQTSAYVAKLEDEIMNGHSSHIEKSDLLERNLNQMVDVLNNRLKDLRNTAGLRMQLSNDDPKGDTKTESLHAPRIGREFDEILPKSYRDTRLGHKDNNLVTTDGVHIDPVKLVFKTKVTTEAAKRLETRLEDTFSSIANMRELMGKKSKMATSTRDRDEASRLNEQSRTEVKRQIRMDLEKELFASMENIVSRSILEPSLAVKVTRSSSEDESDGRSVSNEDKTVDSPLMQWPIPIKWPKRDPRSDNNSNTDGEMNTDLLLCYAIERINLPSGEALFRRLIKQSLIQDYFICLFWLVKLKLFRHVNENDADETWLLRQTAALYSQLITAIGTRAKEEHEKDFVFKYLPYIYCNAIYYSFYFLCPGSRHLYTKGFRKTIYMQIVMIMFGIQLCPAAVKITWGKYFPEDIGEDEANNSNMLSMTSQTLNSSTLLDDLSSNMQDPFNQTNPKRNNGGEIIPVALAFTNAKKAIGKALTAAEKETKSTQRLAPTTKIPLKSDIVKLKRENSLDTLSSETSDSVLDGRLAFDAKSRQLINTITPSGEHALISRPIGTSLDESNSVSSASAQQLLASSSKSINPIHPQLAALKHMKSTSQVIKKLAEDDPLFRTNLLPTIERPRHYPRIISHQVVDTINAKSISPLVQEYLRPISDSKLHIPKPIYEESPLQYDSGDNNQESSNPIQKSASAPHIQLQHHMLRRTVPVSWCRVGGADTYQRLSNIIPKDKIEDLSNKSIKANQAFQNETAISLMQRTQTIQAINEKYHKVLASGTQKISRLALDILKQQQRLKSSASSNVLASKVATNVHRHVHSSKQSTTNLSASSNINTGSNSLSMNHIGLDSGPYGGISADMDLPQVDESLSDIMIAAQLGKDDLLEEFRQYM